MASREIKKTQHLFRLLYVNEEPQRILHPIQGYENTPLVSLNQAIVPLETFIPDIKLMVQTVKANYVETEDGLTIEISQTLLDYIYWNGNRRRVQYFR